MLSIRVVSSAEEAGRTLGEIFEWAERVDLVYAWARAPSALEETVPGLALEKVDRAAIGYSFHNTHPEFLRRLDRNSGTELRLVRNDGGVFHPKLAVGYADDEVRVLSGSSNLTVSGFGPNTELNFHLRGSPSNPEIQKIRNFVEEQWERAEPPAADWLDSYEDGFDPYQKPEPPTGDLTPPVGPVPEPPDDGDGQNPPDDDTNEIEIPPGPDLLPRPAIEQVPQVAASHDLDIEWEEYFDVLKNRSSRGHLFSVFPSRTAGISALEQLDAHRAVFEETPNFADMTEEQREIVSGFGASPSGWFGDMSVTKPAI